MVKTLISQTSNKENNEETYKQTKPAVVYLHNTAVTNERGLMLRNQGYI